MPLTSTSWSPPFAEAVSHVRPWKSWGSVLSGACAAAIGEPAGEQAGDDDEGEWVLTEEAQGQGCRRGGRGRNSTGRGYCPGAPVSISAAVQCFPCGADGPPRPPVRC